MVAAVSVLSPLVQDLGLTPRYRDDKSLPTVPVHFEKKLVQNIQKDKNGEYTFTAGLLNLTCQPHQEFYDGSEKILETYYDDQKQMVLVHVLAKTQTNLFVDIRADQCLIKAEHGLCIDAQLDIKTSLVIDADNLCLLDKINCVGQIDLKTQKGFYLASEVKADKLYIDALCVVQSGDIQVHDHYDLSTSQLVQVSGCNTVVENLRLLTNQCDLAGDFTVKNKCFMVANDLMIGTKDNEPTNVYVTDNHHIHCLTTKIVGDTHMSTHGLASETTNNSQFIVDKYFGVESCATVELKNTALNSCYIKNAGNLYIDQCDLRVDDFNQSGLFMACNANAVVTSSLFQQSSQKSEFKHSLLQCDSGQISQGDFVIDDTALTGNMLDIEDAASLHVKNNSQVKTRYSISCDGEVDIRKSNIHASQVKFSSDNVKLVQSNLYGGTELFINGDMDILACSFFGKYIEFSGILNFDETIIQAKTVEFNTDQGIFNNVIASATQGMQLGNKNLNGELIFNGGCLSAEAFTVLNDVYVNHAQMFGVDDKNRCHDIQGKLLLDDTEFYTDSHIYQLKGSRLQMTDSSEIYAASIYSKGSFRSQSSSIRCTDFYQFDDSWIVESSQINVSNTISTSNTDVLVDNNSTVNAKDVLLGRNTHFKLKGQSLLVAEHEGITDKTSTLDSDQSTIVIKKFVPMGRVTLSKSLLSTDELWVYDQFDASENTMINVDKQFLIAKEACVNLKDTSVSTGSLDSLGEMNVESSQLRAKESISLWSTSFTTFKDTVQVNAKNMLLAGQVVTDKSDLEDDELEAKQKVIMKIENELFQTTTSDVSGTEDLIIDADSMIVSGQVKLDADVCLTGRYLENHGSIGAKSAFFGFDDAVINFGSLSAKNITIHSNFLNIFGQVRAEESLSCAGFVNLNAGLIAANNHTNDSFLSLNSAFIVPNFSADPKYIFSMGNLISATKTVASMMMPGFSSGVQLAGMVPGLISNIGSASSLIDNLNWESLKTKRRYEYMPLLCKAKNLAMFGYGVYNSIDNFSTDVSTWSDKWDKFECSDFNKVDWQNTALHAAGVFAGSFTDNSVLNINTGFTFSANTSKNNFMDVNTGFEMSALSHNVNTSLLFNSGVSAGRESSFTAKYVKNSGTLEGTSRYYFKADQVDNGYTGLLKGSGANVTIKQLNQDGKLDVSNGVLNIKHFNESAFSTNMVTNAAITGDTFDQRGDSHLTNVSIEEKEHFIIHAGGSQQNSNVAIKTKLFDHQGNMDYEHTMVIKAEKVVLAKGSVINGQKTSEEKLFVDKTLDADAHAPTDGKAPEKEFKPDHMLIIEANELQENGKMRGGDYTQEKGLDQEKCKLTIGDTADIDLKRGSISAEHMENNSKHVTFDGFNILSDHTKNNEGAQLKCKNSNVEGLDLQQEGGVVLDHCSLNINEIHQTEKAHETLVDSVITSKVFDDKSQMSNQGQSMIITDKYNHTGRIEQLGQPAGSTEKGVLVVEAKTGVLEGSAGLSNVVFKIDHLDDVASLVTGTGRYSLYHASESFTVNTLDSFRTYNTIERNCDVSVYAADIFYGGTYNQQRDLTFVSTVGDVNLTNQLGMKNLYVKSAANAYTSNAIDATSNVYIEAEGGYYNTGKVNGQDVFAKAAEIKNFGRGGVEIGLINARHNLLMEATKGNIENYGGVLRGGNYAQLIAAGSVLNLCNVKTSQGQYDVLKSFDAALITGGAGEGTDGVGLYIHAGDKVYSDASDFSSNGTNYIEGVHGLEFAARSHTAITRIDKSKTWYGKSITKIDTSTVIRGCNIQSASGRNIIRSSEGTVTSVAGHFIAAGGTDIYAQGNIKLMSMKANDRHIESTSYLWGLSKKDVDSIHECSAPTLFYDNGATHIHSAAGSVDARGAYFTGNGDLSIKAHQQILLGRDILDHQVNEKSNLFNFSCAGKGAWDSWSHGGNAWDMITAEDATLSKINSLTNSHNSAELLANSANLGIDLTNTTNSALRGIAFDGVSEELLARYNLGGKDGFSPSMSISMTQTKSTIGYQTLGQGGIDRGGNVSLEAGEKVVLENGVDVKAGGNIDINTPVLEMNAAALNTHMDKKTLTETLGVSPLHGQVQSLGASYSHTQTDSTQYVNSHIVAGGNLRLHNQDDAMEKVNLNGGNLEANTLDMDTKKLIITDRQNTSKTRTESASVSSTGMFSVYKGKGREQVTNQHSGLDIHDGINNKGHVAHAGETIMNGGVIKTDGVDNFQTDRLESHAMQDVREFNGIGMSGNIHDFERLNNNTSSNNPGDKAIATAAINVDHTDYKAEHQSVVYGVQGTQLDIREMAGDAIHTTSAEGLEIKHNESMHLHVDVPITNMEHLKTMSNNVSVGTEKLKEYIHPQNESNISPEIVKYLIQDAMAEAKLDSPAMKKLDKVVNKASQELKATGKISPELKDGLKKQMAIVLVTLLKEGAGERLKKVIEQIDHPGVKAGLSAKGAMGAYLFNVLLSSLDPDVKKGMELKHAAFLTGAEISFSAVLEAAMTMAAGGLAAEATGGSLVLIGLLDCFYDQQRIDSSNASGVSHLYEAQQLSQQGHPLDAFAMRQMAADQIGSASRAQAGHILSQLPGFIACEVENKWNGYGDSCFRMFKPVEKQAPKLSESSQYEFK